MEPLNGNKKPNNKQQKREYKHYKNFDHEESNKDTNPKLDYEFWENSVTD